MLLDRAPTATVIAISGPGAARLAIGSNEQPIGLITPPAVSNRPGNTLVVATESATERADLLGALCAAACLGRT